LAYGTSHALPLSANEPFSDSFCFYSREDGKRIWERRAPLTPDAVNKLVSTGKVVVEVESCSRRVFTDAEYEKVRHLNKKSLFLSFQIPFNYGCARKIHGYIEDVLGSCNRYEYRNSFPFALQPRQEHKSYPV